VYEVSEEAAAMPAPTVAIIAATAEAFESPQSMPQPRTDGAVTRRSARELFANLPPDTLSRIQPGMMLDHYASPLAPAVDNLYAFDSNNLLLALGALATTPSTHCWLGGPRGTGKTEFCHQLAARLGRPFFRVNFNRATEASDILGGLGIVKGGTEFVPGPVADAVETPGAILLLDELTYGTAGHIASLNPVLERTGAPVRLPMTGRVLKRAAGGMTFIADNTFGHGGGAETMGRTPMASDTLDRIGRFLRFDYLPADVEARVLRTMVERDCGSKPSAAMARDVARVMRVAREKADAGDLQGAPSLRRAAAFCVALVQGIRPADAYDACVVRAAPDDSQEALRQIFAAHWPHKPEDGFAPLAAPTFNEATPEQN